MMSVIGIDSFLCEALVDLHEKMPGSVFKVCTWWATTYLFGRYFHPVLSNSEAKAGNKNPMEH